jgi:hypothetical protein
LPTIDVTSAPLTPSTRLRAAIRLTRWLDERGSQAAHVVVVFRTADPMTYFVGGLPLSTYREGDSEQDSQGARWASVVCHIHPARDHAYMLDLAEEVREALGIAGDSGHCLVRFEPTRPDRVFYTKQGRITGVATASLGTSNQEGYGNADD